MADEPQPQLIDCPNCEKPLVLLSIELYSGLADQSSGDLNELPGEIRDRIMGENIEAKYAVVDREGRYKCDWCGEMHTR